MIIKASKREQSQVCLSSVEREQARLKVKVCGMRDAENIREVERLRERPQVGASAGMGDQRSGLALDIDMMGFIFWPKSKRYVSTKPTYLPQNVKRVGVFVDEDIETVKRIADDYSLDYIQLHGHESPDYIRQLKAVATPRPSVSIIKAFNIATASDLEQAKAYEGLVNYFLFDTKATLPGGSGQQFDWSILDAYNGETPFLLSGGIGPDDAERVHDFLHPKCIGIDLNSRFELSPALKDINKLKEFIKEIRL